MPERTIPLYKVHMPPETQEMLGTVLFSGQIAHGNNVMEFEKELQEYIGNPYITTTRDVSTSIELCLYMAGVRPGDEVLASPMACLATNLPVLNLFAKVRWVDIDPLSGNLSPEDLKNEISPRTKAILTYHWAGNPVNILAINSIAHQFNLPVIEDAGEALGAEYQGEKIGNTDTDFTIFSFHAIRHITTGDGAAIAFGNKQSFERAGWLKRYGIHQPTFRDEWGEINPSSDIPEAGYNHYLNHLAATIGLAQIKHLPEIVHKHQENGIYFDEMLKNIPGITVLRRQPQTKSAYWVYTLLAEQRDSLLKYLRSNGIYASKVHYRNDAYSCFGEPDRKLPGVSAFQDKSLSIPCGWWVTAEDREYIVDVLQRGW
jgi:perosamine synthetase